MRFLQDIVTSVQEATGFGTGLYTPEEVDANAMKEKPAKIQYLDKIINLVGIHLNLYCPVRARAHV